MAGQYSRPCKLKDARTAQAQESGGFVGVHESFWRFYFHRDAGNSAERNTEVFCKVPVATSIHFSTPGYSSRAAVNATLSCFSVFVIPASCNDRETGAERGLPVQELTYTTGHTYAMRRNVAWLGTSR